MTQFDEAIQKAVIEIVFESPHSPHPEEIAAFVDDVITRHFTGIEAVFGKLVELAVLTSKCNKSESYSETFRLQRQIYQMMSDPLVKAAMKGE